jgi:2-C-methyl-D-erythritol 4-phosphate cytidylyltransferase
MRALPKGAEWVGIHDAARPFVTAEDVAGVFQAAQSTGSAILAVPAKDTIKVSKAGSFKINQTLPRERCWLAQTPQVFRRDIAEKIHAKARAKGFTDDASIAEFLGYSVRLVPGSYENIKITTPEDLVLAEKILRKRIHHGA